MDLAETSDLTDVRHERSGSVAGQLSTLRSQVRELRRMAERDYREDEKLRDRVAALESIAGGVEAKVQGALNQALRGPLERVEERLEEKIEKLSDALDEKASKSDHKTLTGRLWTLAAGVLAAVFGGIYKLLGLG